MSPGAAGLHSRSEDEESAMGSAAEKPCAGSPSALELSALLLVCLWISTPLVDRDAGAPFFSAADEAGALNSAASCRSRLPFLLASGTFAGLMLLAGG
jgi:hypothetical protein